MAELVPGAEIDDFRIEGYIGSGGMGVLYRARQLSLNRVVALKVLGAALHTSSAIARFQREAQAVAKLAHPGIIQVHYVGQTASQCYMAMELIDGCTLREALNRVRQPGLAQPSLDDCIAHPPDPAAQAIRFDEPTKTLPPEVDGDSSPAANAESGALTPTLKLLAESAAHLRRCAEIVRDAAAALAHAHAQGVVHRDLKPENIMLDRGGKLRIIDFGIARFFEDITVTYTGQLVGTPLYMSPEQVTGRLDVDRRTDIYSLGIVLRELVALQPPLVAASRESILTQIIAKDLTPTTWMNPALPRDLESIIHRAAAKDRDDRYQTADEFAADLQRFLDGRPVTAKPYRYRYDESEITGARPAIVTLIAVQILVSGTFLAGLGFMAIRSILHTPTYHLLYGLPVDILAPFILMATIGVLSIPVARRLLAGSSWARVIVAAYSVFIPIAWWQVGFMISAISAFLGMEFCILFGVSFVTVALLWTRSVTRWLDHARSVRVARRRASRDAAHGLWRWQFNLRQLFIVTLICAIFLAIVAFEVKSVVDYRSQMELVEKPILDAGGIVTWLVNGSPPSEDVDARAGWQKVLGARGLNQWPTREDVYGVIFNNSTDEDVPKRFSNVTFVNLCESHLATFPTLIQMNLSFSALTDAGLARIDAVSTLCRLNLSDTSVGDAGLAHVGRITNLTTLNLERTQVTDAGLEHLHLLPFLKEVRLYGTKVTDRGVERLRQARPGIEVRR